jgi:hypothetical protein
MIAELARERWRWAVAAVILGMVWWVQQAQAFPVCISTLPIPCIETDGGFVISDEVASVLSQIFAAVLGFIGNFLRGITDAVLSWLVNSLPDAPALGVPSFSGLIVGYAWLNQWVPLDVGLQGLALVYGATIAKFTLRLILTAWHTLPKPFMGT